MDEYIKRELAIEALSRGEGCGNVCRRAIERILADDVAPVRKGRWESVGLSSLKCSDCGYLDDMKMYYRYCPDCGCFMR